MTAKEVFQAIIANNPTDIKLNLVSAGLVDSNFVVTEQNVFALFSSLTQFRSPEEFGQFAGNMLGVPPSSMGPYYQQLLYFANQFGGDMRTAIGSAITRESKLQQVSTELMQPGKSSFLESNRWLQPDKYKQEFQQMYHSFLAAHWLVKLLSLFGAMILLAFLFKKINNSILS